MAFLSHRRKAWKVVSGGGGGGGLTFDNASSTTGLSTNTISWSHTCTGSNLVLIVFPCSGTDPAEAGVTSVTYDGVAMTAITGAIANDGGWSNVNAYYLIAPNAGTHTVVITYPNSNNQRAATAISFTGANQTNPIGLVAINSSNSTANPTVTRTSSAGRIVVGATMTDGLSLTSTSGTQRTYQPNIGSDTTHATATIDGGGTLSWDGDGTNGWASNAIEILP